MLPDSYRKIAFLRTTGLLDSRLAAQKLSVRPVDHAFASAARSPESSPVQLAMLCCFACRSTPTIFISASFARAFWLDPIKVYSGVRGRHTYVISHACSRHLERPDPVFKWYGYA